MLGRSRSCGVGPPAVCHAGRATSPTRPDLVQETALQTFKHLATFEPRGEGALQAYLRQALVNRIRNELRRASSRPAPMELDSGVADEGTSPFEAALAQQTVENYEAGLARLKPEEREAIVTRVSSA